MKTKPLLARSLWLLALATCKRPRPGTRFFRISGPAATTITAFAAISPRAVLAAIQGLNQKLEETQQAVKARDGEIQTLRRQNDSLAERLNKLENNRKITRRKEMSRL